MNHLKSKLGGFSEVATAKFLIDNFKKSGLNCSADKDYNYLYKDLYKELLLPTINNKIRSRNISASKLFAKSLCEDIINAVGSTGNLKFKVKLTCFENKGKSKSDISITVTKNSKTIKTLHASLKVYEDSTINLANTTYISFFKGMFAETHTTKGSSHKQFVKEFISSKHIKNKLYKLLKHQNIISEMIKDGNSKDKARKISKQTHGEVIDILSYLFNVLYQSNKELTNSRILRLLGLDGTEDFYVVIGGQNNQKLVSTRNNHSLNMLVDSLNSDFDVTLKRNGLTNNGNLIFSINGKELLKATISLTDTGGKFPQGKTNIWVKLPI